MIRPGMIVEAKIDRCEQYGVYLHDDDSEIFVHLPELSWTVAGQGPADSRRLLDTVARVKILRWIPEKRQWIGSIKRAHPELNPFIEISKCEPGKVFVGTVAFVLLGAHIRLENGAEGRIIDVPKNRSIALGDKVCVSVASIDPEEGKLELTLAVQ